MNTLRIIVTVFVGVTTTLLAMEDTPSTRAIAADQFLQIYSAQDIVAVSSEKLAQTMPQKNRDILESVIAHLDMQAINQAMRQKLIENFTASELHAMKDLYSTPAGKSVIEKLNSVGYKNLSAREMQVYGEFFSTPAGKSILDKLPRYRAELMPAVKGELMKAALKALPEILRRAATP